MSRLWLLSLVCLSVLCLSLVQLTHATGALRVNETNTRILFEKYPAEVLLAVENSTGKTLNATVEVALLDPLDHTKVKTSQVQSIGDGSQKLRLTLPLSFANLDENERKRFLWYRLQYRLTEHGSTDPVTQGTISLSEIGSDLFDLRVATSDLTREGGRFFARVQASHPITRRPVANVQIDGELRIENDNDKNITLRAAKTTDSHGSALLEFSIPQLFPQFPYDVGLDETEFLISGRRGAVVATVTGQVLIDHFARILLTTDKPLYQPGQTMHLRAVALTPSQRALANENLIFRIFDPAYSTVYRSTVRTSRFGVASTDWSIPENTRLGNYRVWVGIEGSDESMGAGAEVRISRYDLPDFTVNVRTDRAYYLPGQVAEVKVRADYLFGQPLKGGRVRVVRENYREWNHREQKWDVDEGETYEGETDVNGAFVVQIPLATEHENLSNDYRRFKDITFAAYFTDPTTNRTEQRRFDLRVTREAIHVYVMEYDQWIQSRTLPPKFYVTTFYADGSPARCKVNVSVSKRSSNETNTAKTTLATVRTNRYGLAEVNGARWPSAFKEESDAEFHVSAVDSSGLKGVHKEEFSFSDEPVMRVETDKALYRSGEPITAFISSSTSHPSAVVDLLQGSNVIRSERVKLRNGRGSTVFMYRPEFKDKLTVTTYSDFVTTRGYITARTVLYPSDQELKVNVQPSQARYRPGEDAKVNLTVRSPEGRRTESALGVVVLDRAVEERFRTAQEFGSLSRSVNSLIDGFLGIDHGIAGIKLKDLLKIDTSKPVSPELDLLANVLLSQTRRYFGSYAATEFEDDQELVFRDLQRKQLKPLRDALASRYERTAEYPTNEESLRRLLSESHIDFNQMRDPWGVGYRASFSFKQNSDELTLMSAGADKRFDTEDDFAVDQMAWPYFRPLGQSIDRAINEYHKRTGGFIFDANTLRDELVRSGLNIDQVRDRWGKPYRFEFRVNGSHYVIDVKSGGPDGLLSSEPSYHHDDFLIWTSAIDYFKGVRSQIDEVLKQHSRAAKGFPETEQELRVALQNSPAALERLRDAWGRPCYATFRTETFNLPLAESENQARLGEAATARNPVTHVTMARFITLRSMGADGQPQTADDISLAVFTGAVSEERRTAEPQAASYKVNFLQNRGAIYGVVTDANGAAIAGATVTASQPGERHTFKTSTREDGSYGLIHLPPGMYELRFEAVGFTNVVLTNVSISGSQVAQVNATLRPGTITETVDVTDGGENTFTLPSQSVSHSIVVKGITLVTRAGGALLSTPRLREYFPETLVWLPSIETDKQGRAQVSFKLADNITTWKMLVVGSTEDGHFGVAEKEIKAFQPFFLDHAPPRVLTEGDEISLPVTVRNYLERPQKVALELKPENWFSVLGPARKSVNVAAGDATRETFDVRAVAPIKNGKQRVTAIATEDSDAIEKPVTVNPDGEQRSVTAGDMLADRSLLELHLPQTTIPNSVQAELKIYPSLMAHVIESVEGIMKRPYGCGEQTISSTYPSLLVLRHYKQTGGDSPLRAQAERYLKTGYHRLLNYRDENGGFSYWGQGQPDLALTAYALRFLTAAADVFPVDPEVVKQASEWLASQQQADGSWGDDPTLTAYITRVIAQISSEPSDHLKRAFNFLDNKGGELNEPYLLASYALAAIDARDRARARPAIDKLRTLSIVDGSAFYWQLRTYTPFHSWGKPGQVEATALVIQALSKYCESLPPTDCEAEKKLIAGGLLFLLKQKDQYGVWYSTQGTINALDAMSAITSQTALMRDGSGETAVLINGSPVQTIQLPVEDRRNDPVTLDVTRFLTTGTNRIEFRRPGGLPPATVQAVATFYVPWTDLSAMRDSAGGMRLQVNFDKTESRISEEITCSVETARVDTRGAGMLLAEIGLPPGADVDRSSLEAALQSSERAISQYDVLPDRVVIYLWPKTGGVKFKFKFRPRFGLNAKSAPSIVYDYYNPESRAVVAPVTFRVR